MNQAPPNPSKQLLQRACQDLQTLRGHQVVEVKPLPGEGLLLICRVPQHAIMNWNLLAVCADSLSSTTAGVLLMFGHQVLVRRTPQGIPKLLVGGSIQIWGGAAALSVLIKAIQTAEKASVPMEREVSVRQGNFYKVGKDGSGVYGQTGPSRSYAQPPPIPGSVGTGMGMGGMG